jgi:hypothetical protein
VERQLGDRRQEFETLARRLHRGDRLRAGLSHGRVLALLLGLTSFETTCELLREGLSESDTIKLLQETGRDALINSSASDRASA